MLHVSPKKIQTDQTAFKKFDIALLQCEKITYIYVQCLTSSRANFALNFQIHFSLKLVDGIERTQLLLKA